MGRRWETAVAPAGPVARLCHNTARLPMPPPVTADLPVTMQSVNGVALSRTGGAEAARRVVLPGLPVKERESNLRGLAGQTWVNRMAPEL